MWWSYTKTKGTNYCKTEQHKAKQQKNNCNNSKTVAINLNMITGLQIIRHYNVPSVTWPFILVGVKSSVTFQLSAYSKSNRSPSVSWCRYHYNGTKPSAAPYVLLQTTPYVINIKYQSDICDILSIDIEHISNWCTNAQSILTKYRTIPTDVQL